MESANSPRYAATADVNGTYAEANATHDNISVQGPDYPGFDADDIDQALDDLNFYGLPIVICVGLLGNSLAFFIFVSNRQLRLQSSSVYLAFLNIVDNVFLLTVFVVVWLNHIYVPLLHKDGWCQVIVYLSYVTSFLSVYTVVCFTVERAIVVFKPFQRNKWCSPRRAKFTVIGISALSLLLYSFVLWSHQVVTFDVGEPPIRQTVCHWNEDHFTALKLLNVFDTVFTFLLPSLTIGVTNFAIAVKIYKVAVDRRRNLIGNGDRRHYLKAYIFGKKSSSENSNDSYTMQIAAESSKRLSSVTSQSSARRASLRPAASSLLQLRTTRTLLLVSSLFVLLNLPSHSLKIYVFVAQHLDSGFSPSISLLRWQVVTQFLSYVNFSANFFLYCAFSVSFRLALKRSFLSTKRGLFNMWRRCRTEIHFFELQRRSGHSDDERRNRQNEVKALRVTAKRGNFEMKQTLKS